MRKGISPLVAAVILIAATMTIAGILSYWASSFVRTTLETGENATELTSCQAAKFRIYSGTYNNATESLYLILENQRTVDLQLDKLYLFYPNDVLQSMPLDEALEGNELKPLNVTGVGDGFDRGRISTNCPEINVEFSYSEVT